MNQVHSLLISAFGALSFLLSFKLGGQLWLHWKVDSRWVVKQEVWGCLLPHTKMGNDVKRALYRIFFFFF